MRRAIAMALVAVFATAATTSAEDLRKPTAADEVVHRRAEEAMRAYQDADGSAPAVPAEPLDAATADAIAEIETLLSEGEAFIKTPEFALKAGDCFVAAAQRLRALTAEQRRALGKRAGGASTRLTALGRALAASTSLVPPGVDPKDSGAPGDPPAEAPSEPPAPPGR